MVKLKVTELKAVAEKISHVLYNEQKEKIKEAKELAIDAFWNSDFGLAIAALKEEYPDEMTLITNSHQISNLMFKDVKKIRSQYQYKQDLYNRIHSELIIKNISDTEFDFDSLLNEFRTLCQE